MEPAQCGVDQKAIRQALEDAGIESRPLWKPMHLQPIFHGCEVTLPRPLPAREGSVAEALFRDGLCLPSGTALSEGELARVAGVVRGIGDADARRLRTQMRRSKVD